jgi:hypothetical protein
MSSPAEYPTTLAKVKAHIRKTDSLEDDYITDLIAVATDVVERYISRKLITRSLQMWMDFIPGTGNEYTLYGAGTAQIPVRYANIGMFRWFELLSMPVISLDSMHFITDAGVDTVFDASQYIVDVTDPDLPARICLQRGTVWPVDLQVCHSLYVNYKVGYKSGYPTWTPSTAYALGAVVDSNGLSYKCTTAGTSASSGGPSTATPATDGTVVWTYVNAPGVPASIRHAVLLVTAAFYSNRGDNADAMIEVLNLPAVRASLDPYRLLRVTTL